MVITWRTWRRRCGLGLASLLLAGCGVLIPDLRGSSGDCEVKNVQIEQTALRSGEWKAANMYPASNWTSFGCGKMPKEPRVPEVFQDFEADVRSKHCGDALVWFGREDWFSHVNEDDRDVREVGINCWRKKR